MQFRYVDRLIDWAKHWRKIGPKDWASISSGPPHRAHYNTTAMLYETKTQNTHSYTQINQPMHSEMGPVWQNPIQRTVRTVHLSVLMTVQCARLQYTIQHRTVLIISPADKHCTKLGSRWGIHPVCKHCFLADCWSYQL